MIRLARCLLMLMVPLCAAPAPVQTRPTLAKEEVVNHPDGTVSFRVKLNAEGKRAGDFTAYFAGGKKIQEKARYEAGFCTGSAPFLTKRERCWSMRAGTREGWSSPSRSA